MKNQKTTLLDIRKVKEDIIEVLLIENFEKKEYYYDLFAVTIYNNIKKK